MAKTKTVVQINGKPPDTAPTVADLKPGDFFRCRNGRQVYIYLGKGFGFDVEKGCKHHHRCNIEIVKYVRATVTVFER